MAVAHAPLSSSAVKRQAEACGFDLCGIAPAAAHPELQYLREWLDAGYAGEMHYLERSAARRMDVTQVLPSARSVIVFGTIYNTDQPYSTEVADPRRAALARYAWGDDYHVVIQARLDRMVEWLRAQTGDGLEARSYVDTGPVQERVFAQKAGLGWIGKNSCLIHEEHGSWLFLSEIICNLELEPDAPGLDQCGTCTACLDACPTGALTGPGKLDSRRCLAYLTIENKVEIPVAQRPAIGAHAYGCDICQEVCPYNLSPAVTTDRAWLARPGLAQTTLLDLWRRSDDELRAMLKGSAMKRAGVRRFRRNLAVAIGNAGDPAAIEALTAGHAPTAADPLVQEHVRWAVEVLGG
ncbi:MAG: tRNA epoxyqueuosine(34) reductase QueG [Vicinamibacterales bacterium]